MKPFRVFLSTVVLASAASTALAQTPAPQPQAATPALPRVVSPEVLPDHRVTFRLRAAKATEVTITGDFWVQQNRTEKLVKDDQGVWSLTTTESLTPDEYSYWFTVDGIRIPDPANSLIKPGSSITQSMFFVPGPEEEFLEARDVPHGEVRMVYYQSAVAGRTQRMHIYFPPGYEAGKTNYPVVYVPHGGGDEDWGWVSVGRVNFILDNLIAAGKAKPMIVVMPSLWLLGPPMPTGRNLENEALFQKSLFQEIIPYVESHYRVLPGPTNRAFGGLGLGHDQVPNLLWPNFDKFGSVLFVSGGVSAEKMAELEKQYPGAFDNPANTKRIKFFVGDGVNDSSIGMSRNLAAELKKRGYAVTTFETNGTHGWPSFRRCFAEWAKIAFK